MVCVVFGKDCYRIGCLFKGSLEEYGEEGKNGYCNYFILY